jgi:hypothetical protein
MVLTAAQTAAFFQEQHKRAYPIRPSYRCKLKASPTFRTWQTSTRNPFNNLRRPGGRVPDPNSNAAPGTTIPAPAFVFGAESQKRLLVTPQYTTIWRKQQELQPTPLQSNLTSGERMEEEIGLLYLDSPLVTTNGRPKSRSKRQSYTTELRRVKATSRSKPLSPSTGTPTYLWNPVLINSLTNIQGLASDLMPFKTTIQDCRLPLLV